ncbi:hypothetical protein Bcep18194_B2024 [Burkholderia lata]|uniref:Uncharacterized protein n=1 Tax=Burkholderia lata (strain ATCC 17760 / DSM 23089 / LMG 22485 / NCIMB 9086 / R18194 / 383) TaxID=482957 RepID=Q394H9_BURL3|nr:hypothetical protein Bcep18194_B2024 [Burkholderia lata]
MLGVRSGRAFRSDVLAREAGGVRVRRGRRDCARRPADGCRLDRVHDVAAAVRLPVALCARRAGYPGGALSGRDPGAGRGGSPGRGAGRPGFTGLGRRYAAACRRAQRGIHAGRVRPGAACAAGCMGAPGHAVRTGLAPLRHRLRRRPRDGRTGRARRPGRPCRRDDVALARRYGSDGEGDVSPDDSLSEDRWRVEKCAAVGAGPADARRFHRRANQAREIRLVRRERRDGHVVPRRHEPAGRPRVAGRPLARPARRAEAGLAERAIRRRQGARRFLRALLQRLGDDVAGGQALAARAGCRPHRQARRHAGRAVDRLAPAGSRRLPRHRDALAADGERQRDLAQPCVVCSLQVAERCGAAAHRGGRQAVADPAFPGVFAAGFGRRQQACRRVDQTARCAVRHDRRVGGAKQRGRLEGHGTDFVIRLLICTTPSNTVRAARRPPSTSTSGYRAATRGGLRRPRRSSHACRHAPMRMRGIFPTSCRCRCGSMRTRPPARSWCPS